MLLVIARKFNDIYYSMSLPEWNIHAKHYLIIIANRIAQEAFPMQDKFDSVTYLRYEGESATNVIKTIGKLMNIKFPHAETVILSNPILISNQFIINRVKPQNLIFIEDGSMNYTGFQPSNSKLKRLLQFSLGLNQNKILNSINSTYLFYPERATFFFGIPRKLHFSQNLISSSTKDLNFINGKKLLVGQPLYDYGYLSLDEYNDLMNGVINKLGIDFYVPHAFASPHERIDCEILDLSDYNVTLEGIASRNDFEIYSFGSTVLYSCKTINPDIVSILLTTPHPRLSKLDTKFVASFCNQIIRID